MKRLCLQMTDYFIYIYKSVRTGLAMLQNTTIKLETM